MGKKRETKDQREIRLYNDLFDRVKDICTGACGLETGTEDDFFGGEELSRIVPALREVFTERKEREGKMVSINDFLFGIHNLNHYCNVSSIVDFLWGYKVRA